MKNRLDLWMASHAPGRLDGLWLRLSLYRPLLFVRSLGNLRCWPGCGGPRAYLRRRWVCVPRQHPLVLGPPTRASSVHHEVRCVIHDPQAKVNGPYPPSPMVTCAVASQLHPLHRDHWCLDPLERIQVDRFGDVRAGANR